MVAGVVLALVAVAKALDMGFFFALNRSFDPVIDWTYAGSLVGLLRDSFGATAATVMLVLAAALLLAVFVLTPLAVRRLARIAARHRTVSLRAVVSLAVVWALASVLGLHLEQSAPFASATTADYAYAEVSQIPAQLRDQREFTRAAAHDPMHDVPGDQLLTHLRGKDVLFVFVESYGRSAVQGSSFTPGINAVLDRRDATASRRRLRDPQRVPHLPDLRRDQLARARHPAVGAVGRQPAALQRVDDQPSASRSAGCSGGPGGGPSRDIPANTYDWSEGAFYGYDQFYDSRNVGYEGPRFGYPTMPDQYTLDAFQRLELSKPRRQPVMAEIDLITSHAPWSRTPTLIDQADVGDGSVFEGMPEKAAVEDGDLAVARAGASGVRAVDRVLARRADHLRGDLRRRRPGARAAR